jgi:NitT/TauT family transport system substrate-binding protein
VVLARPDILTPEQISGKRIGLENNALGALMLHKLLEAAKLPESAVTLVDCPPEVQVDAWRNDTIDVVITYEPAATAQQRLGAKRIFDSRQMPDTIFDVLAVRTDRADARQDALRDIAAAHFRGLSHIQKNRHDALHRIAARQKMSFDEANRALIGILLPSLSANREYLAATDGRLLPAARLLSSLMVQRLLISHQDTLAGLVNGVWLPNDDSSRA